MIDFSIGKDDNYRSLEEVERDEEGFLLNADDWGPTLMKLLAKEAELELTEERLTIVLYIRQYFEEKTTVPEARTLLKYMQQEWGALKGTRRYLYQLFPRGYGQQACKIAGMTKPRKLMLDV